MGTIKVRQLDTLILSQLAHLSHMAQLAQLAQQLSATYAGGMADDGRPVINGKKTVFSCRRKPLSRAAGLIVPLTLCGSIPAAYTNMLLFPKTVRTVRNHLWHIFCGTINNILLPIHWQTAA